MDNCGECGTFLTVLFSIYNSDTQCKLRYLIFNNIMPFFNSRRGTNSQGHELLFVVPTSSIATKSIVNETYPYTIKTRNKHCTSPI